MEGEVADQHASLHSEFHTAPSRTRPLEAMFLAVNRVHVPCSNSTQSEKGHANVILQHACALQSERQSRADPSTRYKLFWDVAARCEIRVENLP